MTSKYREIMRRQVVGQTNEQIANEVGISLATIKIISRSPLYIAEKEKMEQTLNEKIVDKLAQDKIEDYVTLTLRRASVKAAQANVELLDSANLNIRQKSVFDILDRTGHKAKDHLISEGTLKLEGEIIDDLRTALGDIKDDNIGNDEQRRPSKNTG